MVTSDGDVVAADAVMNVDDDALFRHPDLAEMEDEAAGDDLEAKANEYGFDYVRLDGNVGIIGNGAGLVMTTLDLVDYYGGKPANFLDIGGGAKAERVTNALDMVFSDENVDSVVFNIFGGITRGGDGREGHQRRPRTVRRDSQAGGRPTRGDERRGGPRDTERGPRHRRGDPRRGGAARCRVREHGG